MTKLKSLWAIPVLTLALAACSGEVDNPRTDGRVALNVQAEIGSVATRAAATVFEANDAIGILPVKADNSVETAQANLPYVYDGAKFTAATPYYFQNQEPVTFCAYYPYKEGLLPGTDDSYPIAIDTRAANQKADPMNAADAADARTWRRNDYLAAEAETNVGDPTVNYTFTHAMTQLQLVFKAGTTAGVPGLAPAAGYDPAADDADPTQSGLTGYTLTTPLSMEGTFSPVTGLAVPDPDVTEPLTMSLSGDVRTAGATVTEHSATPLILLPQTVKDGTLGLTLTYNDVPYTATLTTPAEGLEAGKRYTYNVTVTNTGLEVGTVEIKDWTDAELPGGTGEVDATIPEPKVGDYYYADGTYSSTYNATKQVVGLVFYSGHHPNDNSNYSATGIGQKECRGYVVALTDASEEELNWTTDETLAKESVGTEAAADEEAAQNAWSGYYNTEKIKAFAEGKDGIDLSAFPAAAACVNYDGGGAYAAPKASSDWFMPAIGQLWEINSVQDVLSAHIDELQEKLGDDKVDYLSDIWYHSSTEDNEDRECAWAVYLRKSGEMVAAPKMEDPIFVRPILAF